MAKQTVKRNKEKQRSSKTTRVKPTTGKKQSAKSRKRAASDVSSFGDSSPPSKRIKRSRHKAASEEVTEAEELDKDSDVTVDNTDARKGDSDEEVSQMALNNMKYRLTCDRMTFRNNITHPFQQKCLSKKT